MVALETESIMKKPCSPHLALARRKRVLDAARDLARSGRHPDHQSILAELEPMEGFADAQERLRVLRSQLNHLCAMA